MATNNGFYFRVQHDFVGRLAAGSDADLVIWDPEATREISAKTHTSAADFNIFEGTQPHGVPAYVVSNGEIVVDEDGLHVTPGRGRFIPTPPNSLFVYGRVNARDQALAPQKVEREDYDGAVTYVADVCDGGKGDTSSSAIVEEVVISQQATDQFHQRPPTRSGGRHMQESSFSFSGDQFDDTRSSKASSRVLNPPGGRSSGLW